MKQQQSFLKLSVIIPNLHSPIIDQTIQSLLDQETSCTFEIVVVGMDRFKIVESFGPQVTFLKTENPTPPAIARNLGVSVATGDLLLFIDADCIAASNWIEEHLRVHKKSMPNVVVGGGVVFPKGHYLTLADNVSSFHEFMLHIPSGEKDFLPSLNLSIPRKVFEMVGGFNPDYPYPAGEDTDLTMRIKKEDVPLLFNPRAIITHLPRRHTFADLFKHAYRFGKYSIKADPTQWDILYVPFPLRHWLLTVLFSPILAMSVILKMVFKESLPFEYWHTLPVIYFLKISWCIGFTNQIRGRKN